MGEETKVDGQELPPIRRGEDFESLYANNVRFEPTLWDLKLLFGTLDVGASPIVVDQHTAVSLPWMQAKLLAYFLEVNLIIHETDNGSVRLPRQVIPEPFDPAKVQESLKPVWEYIAALHKRFFPEYYL